MSRELSVRFRLDSSGALKSVKSFEAGAQGLDTRLRSLGSSLQGAGRQMSRVGGLMTTRVTLPIIAAGFAMTKSWMGARKEIAQTRAVLHSTGGAANVTARDVTKLTGRLQKMSNVDDDVIRQGANLLLTFTSIRNEVGKGNDVFNQATGAVLDMSIALKQDMKSSAIQVGKALNNPIKGVTALTRAGVSFTDQQKKQIEKLVESGRTLKAQKIILAELNKEFGGSARAAAKAEGPMGKLKVVWDQLSDTVGQKLLPMVQRGSVWLGELATKFQGLGPAQQDTIFKMVALTAVSGPALKVLGSLTTVIGGLVRGLGFLVAHPAIAGLALIAGAAGFAAVKLGLFNTESRETQNAAQAAADAVRDLKAAQDELKDITRKMPQLKLNKSTAERSEREAKAYVRQLKEEGASKREIAAATDLATQAEINRINANEALDTADTRKGELPGEISAKQQKNRDTARAEQAARAADKVEAIYNQPGLRARRSAQATLGGFLPVDPSGEFIDRMKKGFAEGTITIQDLNAALRSTTLPPKVKDDLRELREELGLVGDATVEIGRNGLRRVAAAFAGLKPVAADAASTILDEMVRVRESGGEVGPDLYRRFTNAISGLPTATQKQVLGVLARLGVLDRYVAEPTVAVNDQASGVLAGIRSRLDILSLGVNIPVGYTRREGGGFPTREAGGPVRKGQPYVVGEKRPELFVPDSDGKILPGVPAGGFSRGGGGGGGITVNVKIDNRGAIMREALLEQFAAEISMHVAEALRRTSSRRMAPLLEAS